MDAKTQRILESVQGNCSGDYVAGRVLIVLKAELNLLSAEHSFLTELQLERIGAPKCLLTQTARRLREIEKAMILKEAEIQTAKAANLGISA